MGRIIRKRTASYEHADRKRRAAGVSHLAPNFEHIAKLGWLVKDQLGNFFRNDPPRVHLAAGVDRGALINPSNQAAPENGARGV